MKLRANDDRIQAIVIIRSLSINAMLKAFCRPGGGGVLPMIANTGRLRPVGVGISLVEV